MRGDMRHVVTEASLSTRASQWWSAIPFVTAFLVAVCSAIYGVQLILGYDTFSRVCLMPYLVLNKFQVYRIYTSVIFHASIFHVVFNMLALVPIGSSLERMMGTVRFLHVIVLLITSNGVIDVALAYVAAHNPIHALPDLSVECAIGFSGVIFALIVIETRMSGIQKRSIFGFFSVPAYLYPWALLFLFQLLVPGVSLVGHLSGILSGFAYAFGIYERALCGPSVYSALESSSFLEFCVRRPGFIVGGTPSSGSLPSFVTGRLTGRFSQRFGGSSGAQRLRERCRNMWGGVQSAVAAPEAPVDERFPGRGRTLGSISAAPPPTQTTGNSESRAPNNGGQANAQASPFNRDAPHSGGVDRPSIGRTTSPTPGQAGIIGPAPPVAGYPIPNQVPNDSPALQSLVAMGFDKTKAVHALAASNGDVTLAVEFLSAEGQQ